MCRSSNRVIRWLVVIWFYIRGIFLSVGYLRAVIMPLRVYLASPVSFLVVGNIRLG